VFFFVFFFVFVLFFYCGRSTVLDSPFILLVITVLSMSISKVQSSAPTFLCFLFLQHYKPFLGHILSWTCYLYTIQITRLQITNTVSMQASKNMLLIHKLILTTVNAMKTYVHVTHIHQKLLEEIYKIYKPNHSSDVLFCR
jgi:hypothetical protein